MGDSLQRLEPETINVRVHLNGCDMYQHMDLPVTQQEYQFLRLLETMSKGKHDYLSCYPNLEVEVLNGN